MMCPIIVFQKGKPIASLGTGGSNRIRTALLQVLTRYLFGGESIENAVNAPRIHYEGGEVYVERMGIGQRLPNQTLRSLKNSCPSLTIFDEPNIFFGGVHGAGLKGSGVGDLRRGGVVSSS